LLAFVAPQLLLLLLLLLLLVPLLKLHEYPPMYTMLIDPPYEFAPNESPSLFVKALQFEQAASRTLTLKSLAFVAPQLLLLTLLLTPMLALHAYPPIYITLIDPPYEFAPNELNPLVDTALQLKKGTLLILTLILNTLVDPTTLLLPATSLPLQAYAPI
jgi:hypothetical protein